MSGRIIIDISGFELTRPDRVRILNSNCAGVILFARNFDNKDQLKQLIRQINAVKEEPLIICVDQEGGRVQRFRNGFTKIPPMRLLGEIWDRDPAHGCVIACVDWAAGSGRRRKRGCACAEATTADLSGL